ncbi:MAG TPA: glycosyltransferase family 2 protein [Acidimicrobiales bacterium]|nr:glycosyltransferase family 2 protein [Acidimicrobiales bacterium]
MTTPGPDMPGDHTPQVNVIVVAYGPVAALTEALETLGAGVSVVVVDNASSSATEHAVAGAGARYVDPGRNLGFAAAVNRAMALLPDAEADVLLLNPDARITPSELQRLHAELLTRPDVACVAPVQHRPGTGGPSRAHWPWHTPGGAWADAVGLGRRRLDSERYFLGGAVLLLRRRALTEVGLFDERFFLYGEDEDWQRRALDRGWRVRLCPEVTAVHGSGGTESDPARLQLRLHASLERYMRKWFGVGGWELYRAGMLFGLVPRALLGRGRRRRSARRLARLYVRGPDRMAQRAGAVPGPGG